MDKKQCIYFFHICRCCRKFFVLDNISFVSPSELDIYFIDYHNALCHMDIERTNHNYEKACYSLYVHYN